MTPTKRFSTIPFVLWFIGMIVSGVALLVVVLVAYHTTNAMVTQGVGVVGAVIYVLFGFASAIFAFNVSD